MVSRPRRISPKAAARRSLLVDVLCAIALTLAALTFSAGLGIVGVIAVLTLIAIGLWFAIEALVRAIRRPGGAPRAPADRGPDLAERQRRRAARSARASQSD
jgi:type VI protein secretion system component VasK